MVKFFKDIQEFTDINIKSGELENNLNISQKHNPVEERPKGTELNQMKIANTNPLTTAANQIANVPQRTKIKTISERDSINTNANINTEEGTVDTNDTDSDEREYPQNQYNFHEFSISTLDRKLNELKKIKNDAKRKRQKNSGDFLSVSNDDKETYTYSSPKNKPICLSKQFTTRMSNVTIMMNPSKLINEHMSEIQLRIIGHTRAAISYEKKEKIIGYPVTILSSFLTSAIMMSISGDESNDKDVIKYISLILSITSFLFSVSRDYLNFSKKFQSHDLSSKLYTTLLRSVEVRLINNNLGKDEKRDIFKDIVDQMSIIEQYETPVPVKIDSNVRREHAEMMEYTES